jgi:zinc transporter 5/7
MASVFLPLFAAIELGGTTVALLLLLTASSGLGGILGQVPDQRTLKTLGKYKYTLAMILLATIIHITSASLSTGHGPTFLGWFTLYASLFVIPGPGISLTHLNLRLSTISSGTGKLWETPPSTPNAAKSDLVYPLIASPQDIKLSAIAGYILAGVWTILYMFSYGDSFVSKDGLISFCLSTIATTASVFFMQRSDLKTDSKYGVAAGCTLIVISGQLLYSSSWRSSLFLSSLSGLAYLASFFDKKAQLHSENSHGHHDHAHAHHSHKEHSKFTGVLLSITTPGSVLHSVLLERDSRRIAYFGW